MFLPGIVPHYMSTTLLLINPITVYRHVIILASTFPCLSSALLSTCTSSKLKVTHAEEILALCSACLKGIRLDA